MLLIACTRYPGTLRSEIRTLHGHDFVVGRIRAPLLDLERAWNCGLVDLMGHEALAGHALRVVEDRNAVRGLHGSRGGIDFELVRPWSEVGRLPRLSATEEAWSSLCGLETILSSVCTGSLKGR